MLTLIAQLTRSYTLTKSSQADISDYSTGSSPPGETKQRTIAQLRHCISLFEVFLRFANYGGRRASPRSAGLDSSRNSQPLGHSLASILDLRGYAARSE
jgi:hypothetical protein